MKKILKPSLIILGISIFISEWLVNKLPIEKHHFNVIGAILIILNFIIFTYLTYHPVKIDLFYDHNANKYGIDNFKFEVLLRGLTLDEANQKEIELIKEKNSLVPYGYNVATGGKRIDGVSRLGADNSNAHLTEVEAQYILDNRDKPMYILYDLFCDKISYESFRKVYHHQTYTNLTTTVSEYPYNFEFGNQFTNNPLEYDEIVSLRERYANGEYWRDVYKDYEWAYKNEWSFYNVYTGRSYKLIMPEVFTEENKKKHHGKTKQGTRNPKAKLTEEQVIEIRRLHKDGISNSELYKAFPQVSSKSIRDIINGKTWKHLL